MRTILKILGWAGGLVLVGAVHVGRRGGSYPSYPAAGFAKLTASGANGAAARELEVETDAGSLRGAAVGSAVAFRGIPYARPPVGELRWRAPEPPASWSGVRDATRPGSPCVQRLSGLTPFIDPMARAYGSSYAQEPLESSEDCLYLDVWVPGSPPTTPLPVMVWLHGGSNVVGSGTQTTYDGVALAARGVVLVTLDYRLGTFGFFSHPELTAESPHRSSGNSGLADQLAALTWVQRNIARFGGDPRNVTLFGESAGAIDAGWLMTSPLSAGLFRRVISQSGPALGATRTLAEAEAFGTAVGALAPTVDGWVLPRPPRSAFVTGSIQKVDLMIGLTAREFSAFRVGSPEIPYVFGTLHDRSWAWLPFTPDDAALSTVMQTYWTNFAKTGDPNASGLPNWPVWTDDAKEFLVIGPDASLSARRNFPPLFARLSAGDLRRNLQ